MRRLISLAAAVVAATGVISASPAHAAPCGKGYVGLTFDDGPTTKTQTLLNVLAQNGLRATMFNEGRFAAAGGGTPKLFRPPFGTTNSTVKSVAAKYGLREIIWDISTGDTSGLSIDRIVQANSRLTNGQVVLMHDGPPNTIAALPRIAQGLASRGLCAGMISPQTGRAVAPS